VLIGRVEEECWLVFGEVSDTSVKLARFVAEVGWRSVPCILLYNSKGTLSTFMPCCERCCTENRLAMGRNLAGLWRV